MVARTGLLDWTSDGLTLKIIFTLLTYQDLYSPVELCGNPADSLSLYSWKNKYTYSNSEGFVPSNVVGLSLCICRTSSYDDTEMRFGIVQLLSHHNTLSKQSNIYTATLSVKKVSWEVAKVQQHGVLLPHNFRALPSL